jgi:tetratricopeptide (TPR) repeat protein
LPSDAIRDLAVAHQQFGNTYSDGNDLDLALAHYRRSISYKESAGDLYGAALTRRNVAIALAQGNHMADAKEYALAALRNYEAYGASASKEVQQTLELITDIEKDIQTESAERNE